MVGAETAKREVEHRRTKAFSDHGKEVGERIIKYLREAKITQAELAEKCFPNVKIQLVNRRLKGIVDMSIGEYMAICDYLNVPYGTFMEEN